jgi:OST-HTH Associated domain/OST-HTH/LOTUS domain
MESGLRRCEECNEFKAVLQCLECEQKFCEGCNDQIHRGGKRKTHTRVGLCNECQETSTRNCLVCHCDLCEICSRQHFDHRLKKIKCKNTVAIYWDLNSNRILTDDDITSTILNIQKLYDSIELIKVYGNCYYKFKNVFNASGAEFSQPEGLKETEAIFIDVSHLSKDKVSQILIISSKASQLKTHLNQIHAVFPKIEIFVSMTFPILNLIPLSELRTEVKSYLAPPKPNYLRPLSTEQRTIEKASIDQFPIYQNFQRKKGQTYSHDHLLTYLKELADLGIIMHESGWLSKNFASKSRISIEKALNTIRESERLGHLHTTERGFCDLKTMFFTSLKLESISLEILLWTLRSLKIDEMLPTERAVQSRMKEVFDFKVSLPEWGNLMEVCKGMYKHHHTKSAPEQVKTNYSLFSSQQSFFSNSTPVFIVKDVLDPVTGLRVHVIYPKDEEWESKDQHIKEGDSLGVKNTPDWQAYVEFLSDYFSYCKPGDDSRAIPGGRYGCAQFLKLCGNQKLRECSLGKLSYMVQLSIDEDLLRYHKTLLIWVPSSNKVSADKENQAKIITIQSTIAEILRDSREGMSLAQLPLYIRRKLSFSLDLAELGFAKLKDLLLTMPEVEIELRGANHPFAVYKSKRKRNREEEIKKILTEILSENTQGLPGPKLEILLNSKLGYFVNWAEYKCDGIYEYIEKKTGGVLNILGNNDSRIVFKPMDLKSGDIADEPEITIKIFNISQETVTEENQREGILKALSR